MAAYFTAGIFVVLNGFLLSIVVGDYRVGIGIADTTGPVAEVIFMGYAKSSQVGTGLHLRQFSRAFIIEDDNARILFVSVDAPMVGHGLRKQVLDNLQKNYNDTYTEKNFILSATHTHSTPGGAMMDLLFDFTTFGFVRETFQALSEGITRAIMRAHDSMQDAKIFYNSGELLNANINRSPLAYLLNPHEERQRYQYNTDKEMSQLKFVEATNNKLLGSIQWFPVHPTSMNNTNNLVSSDNVGYASILLEEHINNGTLPGKGSFVGAFASSNLGDVSPNIRGPHCLNNGLPCDDVTSTCEGDAKICVASGPGSNMFGSTKIIGERLYGKALELLEDNNAREVTGKLRIGHQYVHMPSQVIKEKLDNGTEVTLRGCISAMGYSFAAGTTDGPGEFDFKQGTVNDNMLWNILRNAIAVPTVDDIACHHPKPILLLTGRIKYPYEWQPQTIAIQTAVIGNVVLAAVPGEFTTMAGRRLRDSIKKTVKKYGGDENVEVIISGLSNIYSDYVVTPEEYQLQRYEGASTIYGPSTLPIYLNLYNKLIGSLYSEDEKLSVDQPSPPDLSKNLISFIPPVIYDWSGFKLDFGDCLQQPPSVAAHGDVVVAKFVAGHPRNNVMQEKTFLNIERHSEDDEWEIIASDANWETKFIWERTSVIKGSSTATIEWTITEKVKPGVYRIRHFGFYKYILGGIFPYEGLSDNFRVL